MKNDNSWLVEPKCINDGCGNKVHTRKINKNGTRDTRSECNACHLGGRKRPGVIQHKKTYCENIDDRLGFICKAEIKDPCQLEMDHKDGDSYNNVSKNVQTLCRDCHAYKTKLNGDSKNNKRVLYTDLNLNEIETTLTRYMN